jgi:hypothetical protein
MKTAMSAPMANPATTTPKHIAMVENQPPPPAFEPESYRSISMPSSRTPRPRSRWPRRCACQISLRPR